MTASVPVPDPAATDVPAEIVAALVNHHTWADFDPPGPFIIIVQCECGASFFDDKDAARHQAEQLMPMVSRMVADAERAARVAALREAEAAIVGSVRYGAELNYDGAEDPGMAAYVEGVGTAARIVAQLREATP